MDPDGGEPRLVTILSANVVDSSRRMAEGETAAIPTLNMYREEIEALVRSQRGRLIDFTGNGFLAEFSTVLDALRCAVEIQRVVRVKNAGLPEERRMEFRIGIHLGNVRVDGERISGDGVDIAARLGELAEPGGICVSEEVYRLVEDQPGVEAAPLGEREFEHVDRPVSVFEITSGPAGGPAGPGPETGPSALPGSWALFLAVLVLVLVVVGGVRWWAGRIRIPVPAPIESLAVLPLENLSGDPSQEYLADGMTEALIGDLARIGSLRVISRTSVMQYKDARQPLAEVARDLNVDAVVEGAVTREGDRVRIDAKLTDTRNDRRLWTHRYDRDLRDILALQGEVARTIARKISIRLTPDEEDRLSRARQVRSDTHEAYLKGRHHLSRRTVESLRKAIQYFERAIKSDPEYAAAHAGVADSYLLLAVYGVRPREVMPSARAAAVRALELDDTLAEAHASLAAVRLWYEWNLLEAEKGFKRAIALNPSYATTRQWYSNLLIYTGRIEEGLAEARRAQELDPRSPMANTALGIVYYYHRWYDQATERFQAALEMDLDFLPAHLWLGFAYAQRSMYGEAIEEFREAMELRTGYAGLGYVYALQGSQEEALAIEQGLWRRSRLQYVSPAAFVRLYMALGEAEHALDWMEEAYDERDLWLLPVLTIDPAFDPLRSHPRFQEFARSVGFPPAEPGG